MTCKITGIVRTPDGALFKNGTITFYRQSGVGSMTDGGDSYVVIPEKVKATTNSAGEIDTTLTYGSYRATAEGIERTWQFLVGVPNVSAISFYECVELIPELSDTISGAVLGYKEDAEAAATTATTKASEASTSAGNAADSATTAQKWAANPEDTEVTTGLYSALHYAAKASDSATAAQAAALTADVHKDTFTALDAATDIISGQIVSVAVGFNGQRENGLIVAAGTYTADGSLVRDLTGISGQWVSYRREFASFSEMISDPRTLTAGTTLTVPSIGATYSAIAASGNLGQTNAGGQNFNVISEVATPIHFGCVGDGTTTDTTALRNAISSSLPIDLLNKTYLTGKITIPDGKRIHSNNATFKAITNLNDDLVAGASAAPTGIIITGRLIIDGDYTNQTGTTGRGFVFSNATGCDVSLKVVNIPSHGVLFANGGSNRINVIADGTGKKAAGYCAYIYNSTSNLIWFDGNDGSIGLAIEASGTGKDGSNNVVLAHRATNMRGDFSQSGAGYHEEVSSGATLANTFASEIVCIGSLGQGIVLSSTSGFKAGTVDVRNNDKGGLVTFNAADFFIGGGVIDGNGAGAGSGYKAQVRLDDSGLSGSTGRIYNCRGSGTVEGVKMFSTTSGAVDFYNCDFEGTTNNFNVTAASNVFSPETLYLGKNGEGVNFADLPTPTGTRIYRGLIKDGSTATPTYMAAAAGGGSSRTPVWWDYNTSTWRVG